MYLSQKLHTNSRFANLRAIADLFSFFYTLCMIRVFSTVLRFVWGFLSDKYHSNAKLAIIKAEAVLEMTKLELTTVASPALGFS